MALSAWSGSRGAGARLIGFCRRRHQASRAAGLPVSRPPVWLAAQRIPAAAARPLSARLAAARDRAGTRRVGLRLGTRTGNRPDRNRIPSSSRRPRTGAAAGCGLGRLWLNRHGRFDVRRSRLRPQRAGSAASAWVTSGDDLGGRRFSGLARSGSIGGSLQAVPCRDFRPPTAPVRRRARGSVSVAIAAIGVAGLGTDSERAVPPSGAFRTGAVGLAGSNSGRNSNSGFGPKMTAVPSSGGGNGRTPICSRLASKADSCRSATARSGIGAASATSAV